MDYQDKTDQLIIRAKRTNYLSEQRYPTGYHERDDGNKRD